MQIHFTKYFKQAIIKKMALLNKLDNYKNIGLLIIRIGLGIMFIYHGFPKITGGPAQWEQLGGAMNFLGIGFFPAFWGFMAAATEFIGGFLLIIGWQFRVVSILQVLNLVVAAAFHFGQGQGLGDAAHAVEDCIVFAGLIFTGAGLYSLDNYNSKKKLNTAGI
jgi:putative oxidoreductase